MQRKKSLTRVALAAVAWLVTSGLAPQELPRITIDDLPLCRSEISLARQMEIKELRKRVAEFCGNDTYSPEQCKELNDKANRYASMDDLDWYVKSAEECDPNSDSCSNPLEILNETKLMSDPEMEALWREIAARKNAGQTEAEREESRESSSAASYYAALCVARIWVAKKDGVPFVPLDGQTAAPSDFAPDAGSTGGGSRDASACADTPEATLARFDTEMTAALKLVTPSGESQEAKAQQAQLLVAEALKKLEPLRACLGPLYAPYAAQLEDVVEKIRRDKSLEGTGAAFGSQVASRASDQSDQGDSSEASACAATPDATLARFKTDYDAFVTQNPPPEVDVKSGNGSGARAQLLHALFLANEGLKLLEPLRECLGPHYAPRKKALEAIRDASLDGCQKVSTEPATCVSTK